MGLANKNLITDLTGCRNDNVESVVGALTAIVEVKITLILVSDEFL